MQEMMKFESEEVNNFVPLEIFVVRDYLYNLFVESDFEGYDEIRYIDEALSLDKSAMVQLAYTQVDMLADSGKINFAHYMKIIKCIRIAQRFGRYFDEVFDEKAYNEAKRKEGKYFPK